MRAITRSSAVIAVIGLSACAPQPPYETGGAAAAGDTDAVGAPLSATVPLSAPPPDGAFPVEVDEVLARAAGRQGRPATPSAVATGSSVPLTSGPNEAPRVDLPELIYPRSRAFAAPE